MNGKQEPKMHSSTRMTRTGIAEIVSAIAVVIGLVFVGMGLRQDGFSDEFQNYIDGSIASGTALTPQTYPDHQRGKGQDKWPIFS